MNVMLPAKTPTEAKTVTWDFSDDVVGTLTGPSVTKTTIVGNDPSAAGLGLSAPIAVGSSVITVVSAGLDDCTYHLLCTVSDSSGQVHQSGANITTTTDAA